MGVDFTHCKASWAYSGFGRFRRELYNFAGFSGDLYADYDDGKFLQAKDHALFPLWNHSDCDGHLTPKEMTQLIPAMKELVPKLKDSYDRMMGQRLIEGMEDAVANHERLEFH